MVDVDLVPREWRDRAGPLAGDAYEGLLSSALRPGENVLLACEGWFVKSFLDRPNAVGDKGMLVLTDRRILVLRPRKRAITGKVKERPATEIPLGEVFNAGVHRSVDHHVLVSQNDRGRYEGHRLELGADNGGVYAEIWAVTIKDAAELAGGMANLPPGVER